MEINIGLQAVKALWDRFSVFLPEISAARVRGFLIQINKVAAGQTVLSQLMIILDHREVKYFNVKNFTRLKLSSSLKNVLF